MIRERQHWMVLVRPGPAILLVLGLTLAGAAANPGESANILHVTPNSPAFLLAFLQTFYEYRILCGSAAGRCRIYAPGHLEFMVYFLYRGR